VRRDELLAALRERFARLDRGLAINNGRSRSMAGVMMSDLDAMYALRRSTAASVGSKRRDRFPALFFAAVC
jgi:hypothetical protein